MTKSFRVAAFAAAVFFCFVGSAFAAKAISLKTEIASFDKHGNANLAITGTVFSANGFGLSDIVSVKVGSAKFDAPIGKDYSDVDNGDYILRINNQEISLAINMNNFQAKTGAKVGDAVTITMKEKLGYLRMYQSRVLKKSDERKNFASDEVFANFRAVQTGSIAANRLYRSVNPVEIDARAPYAAALLEKSGIKTIVNLADTEKTGLSRAASVPAYQKLVNSGSVSFLNMGAAYADVVFTRKMRDAMLFIIKHEGPYLIHGKEGKIRTGFVIAVLEALSGATMNEIDEDFMKSYEDLHGVRKDTVQYAALAKTVPTMFETISGGKKITDKNLQSLAEDYLKKNVGLTGEEITALKARLR